MSDKGGEISHVSDTALWVAHYRAEESERPDALFHDPYARSLAGEKGRRIAAEMASTSRYTAWTLSIRTLVIDRLVEEMIARGVDTVINLGAGLDARPYRMKLPAELRWIEVDYPEMLAHKAQTLAAERPRCQLERIPCDLAQRDARRNLFAKLAERSRRALVITEGVIPYLSEEQVGELAEDLAKYPALSCWIAEYFSPSVYPYLRDPRHAKRMKNAPFRFLPSDWLGFFRSHGWVPVETRYLGEESRKVGWRMPLPWWAKLLLPILPVERKRAALRTTAYILFGRAGAGT